jgi:hypothetical protein
MIGEALSKDQREANYLPGTWVKGEVSSDITRGSDSKDILSHK